MAVVTGAVMAGAGALSTIYGASEMRKAKKYLKENKALWKALQTPSVENLQVSVQDAIASGKLDPKMGQAILQDPSFMKEVGANPQLVQAQEQSLQSLQDVGRAGGQDAMTRARMAETMGQVGQQERASREALQSQAQRRGIGGSGVDLAQQAIAQQRGADRAGMLGFQTAADAEQRALQALSQSGQLAGQMRGQQFSEDAQRAQAMDRIAQFNTRHRQQLQEANIGRDMQAQQFNLGMGERNVDRQMQARYHNTGAYQKDFQNRAQRTQGISGANTALSQNRQQTGQMFGRLGGSLMSSGGQMIASGVGGGGQKPQPQTQSSYKPNYNTGRSYNPNQLMAADGAVVTPNNQGGMVPGTEYAGDRVDAQVNSGEMILNVEQQQNLLDLLAGKTNQIDASQPIVQDTGQNMGQETAMQEPQQPMEGGEEMDPLAAARQMQEQQAPKLAPDFQPTAPTAPMTPPQDPIAALQPEQPIQAADGAVVPQPWQQEVYGGMPPQPYQPHPDDMPPQPIAPIAQGPTSSPNVQQMEFEPIEVTSQSPTPKSMVEGQNPIDLLNQKQQQQPQQPMEQQGQSNWQNTAGKAVAGLGDAVSTAFGGKTQGFQQIMDKEEREKARQDQANIQEANRISKMEQAIAERKQKFADAQLKRKQDMEDFRSKEAYKASLKKKEEEKDTGPKDWRQIQEGLSSEGKKSLSMTTKMMTSFGTIEKLIKENDAKSYPLVKGKLKTSINEYINAALRRESGAAISDEEYTRYLGFVPNWDDDLWATGLTEFKLNNMKDTINSDLFTQGISLPEFAKAYDKHTGGKFLNRLGKNSSLKAESMSQDLSGMDDPQLEAEAAKWDAENAR